MASLWCIFELFSNLNLRLHLKMTNPLENISYRNDITVKDAQVLLEQNEHFMNFGERMDMFHI